MVYRCNLVLDDGVIIELEIGNVKPAVFNELFLPGFVCIFIINAEASGPVFFGGIKLGIRRFDIFLFSDLGQSVFGLLAF